LLRPQVSAVHPFRDPPFLNRNGRIKFREMSGFSDGMAANKYGLRYGLAVATVQRWPDLPPAPA